MKQNALTSFFTSKWIRFRRSKILKKLYKKLFILAGKVLPVDEKSIVLESFLGKQYSDNPRALYEKLQIDYPDYKLYWSVSRGTVSYFKDKDVPFVRRFSLKWMYVMNRSKYWISNSRLPLWIKKPDHTVYLQTWHGTPLKRLASDMEKVKMPGTTTKKYKKNFRKEANRWDILVSPNEYSTEIFRRAFRYKYKIIETGYPRNDVLINNNKPELIEGMKIEHNLPLNKKVILYAPTWRDNNFYHKGMYKFDLELDLRQMQEELGKDYIVVLRLHYLIAENLDISEFQGFAYDFSKHEDISELYLMSDMLITDYSSVFFDYANLRKPIIFFTYDIEDYRDNLRGFYFDLETEAPGPLVLNTDEVLAAIRHIEEDGNLPQNYEKFLSRFCSLEKGESSAKVIEELFKYDKSEREKIAILPDPLPKVEKRQAFLGLTQTLKNVAQNKKK